MRLQGLTLISLLSLFFIGCNDDISRNRQSSNSNNNGGGQTLVKEVLTVYSGIHRDRETAPITYAKEININSDSAGIRRIPDVNLDDDGSDGKNVDLRSELGRPTVVCGTNDKSTLKEKIDDCASTAKNGNKAIWNGTNHGISTSGLWKLVTLGEIVSSGEKYEVWQDERTGMVWSDIIDTEGNWCESSGSIAATSPTMAVDCQIVGKGASLCTNLNLPELPGVTWRLPTRSDYLQADLDGIRFVLKPGDKNFWSSTVATNEEARNSAWTYNMANGTLVAENMSTDRNVRCMGTPNF